MALTPEGTVAFDEASTAQGGLRLPMVAVPVASYGEGLAVLSEGCPESVTFGAEKLSQLYGSHDTYLDAYHRSVWGLVQDGLLLSEDVDELMATAEAVPFQ